MKNKLFLLDDQITYYQIIFFPNTMHLPSFFCFILWKMQSIVFRDQSIFMLIVQGGLCSIYIYSTEHYKSNFDQGQFVLVHKSAAANYSSAVENFWGQNKIGNASLSIQIIIGNHFCLVQKEDFFFLFLLVLFFLQENLR